MEKYKYILSILKHLFHVGRIVVDDTGGYFLCQCGDRDYFRREPTSR